MTVHHIFQWSTFLLNNSCLSSRLSDASSTSGDALGGVGSRGGVGSFSGVGSLSGVGSFCGVGSLGGGLTSLGACFATGDTNTPGDGDLKPFDVTPVVSRGDSGVVERVEDLLPVSESELLRPPGDFESTTVLCMPVGVGFMVTLRSAWKPGLRYWLVPRAFLTYAVSIPADFFNSLSSALSRDLSL